MTNEDAIDNLKYMISDNCTETQHDFIEEIEIAIKALEKQLEYRWHDLRKDKYDLPDELKIVNVTWTNHNPPSYYNDIKGKLFSDASAVFFNGKWYWWTSTIVEILMEYGKLSTLNSVDESIEIVSWKEIEAFDGGEQE